MWGGKSLWFGQIALSDPEFGSNTRWCHSGRAQKCQSEIKGVQCTERERECVCVCESVCMYVCVSVTLKRLDVVTYRCCQQLVLPRRSCSCGNNRSARTRVPGRPKEPYIVGSSREVSPFVQKTHLEFNPSRWVVKHRFSQIPTSLSHPHPPSPFLIPDHRAPGIFFRSFGQGASTRRHRHRHSDSHQSWKWRA